MEYIQREINKKEAKEKNNKDKGKNLICCDAVTIYQLGDAWILYSKHLFRISMHKMHSKKKKHCIFGWDFDKYKIDSRQNVFCKFTILEQKSESKKLWILILLKQIGPTQ